MKIKITIPDDINDKFDESSKEKMVALVWTCISNNLLEHTGLDGYGSAIEVKNDLQ